MSKKKREPVSGVEAKYEEVRQLLAVGKERGFLAYDEINESLPDEISASPDEIEEVFSLFEAHGITVVDADAREQLGPSGSAPAPKEAAKDEKEDEGKDAASSGASGGS
jgi:RNA polymerase primary sigma factor